MFIVGLILGVLVIIFVFQNLDAVSYQFLFWTLTAPRFLVLLVILMVGMIIGWSSAVFRRRRREKKEAAAARGRK